MALDLSLCAAQRTWTPDKVTITVTNKSKQKGNLSDAITDAKRFSGSELESQFGSAAITRGQAGFVIWKASLTNLSEVTPGNEIIDGSEVFVVKDVKHGHFEAARQYICLCNPKVTEG